MTTTSHIHDVTPPTLGTSLGDLPRPEYPRPQFERREWINLNGPWSFSFDFGKSGFHRKFYTSTGFNDRILVPFCPESEMSGIGFHDFIETVWYHRKLTIPAEWSDRRILLHFGGVDYESEIFIDGKTAGVHWGGSSSFFIDITSFVIPGGTHDLVVYCRDDVRSGVQTGGKQSIEFKSQGCFYTRTAGIWQTVWMESVSPYALKLISTLTDSRSGAIMVTPWFFRWRDGLSLRVTVTEGDRIVAQSEKIAIDGVPHNLRIDGARLWSPETPFLYDMQLDVVDQDGRTIDSVSSYCGIRTVRIDGPHLLLNDEPLYLRLVLDQGFYRTGIWTAPTDHDLVRDIELSLAAGFNGARLHQKVFEERFHYHADRMGYLTWAESPSWALDIKSDIAARNFLSEWREIVLRDRNHPSIITWTPLNETWDTTDMRQARRLHVEAYDLTKELDPSRPINEASGGCHYKTDLYTVHIYEQDPAKLQEILTPKENGEVFRTLGEKEVAYEGQPYIVDEFGGIKWIPDHREPFAENSWGYGSPPNTLEEFYSRLEGQVDALLALPHIAGYCYTQLTDVEQEENGLYNYDRSEKFDMSIVKRIFSKVPERRH